MVTDKIFWASMIALAANILLVIKIFYRVYWDRKVLMDFPKFKYQKDCKIVLLMFIFFLVLFISLVFFVLSIIAGGNYNSVEGKIKLILATVGIMAITASLHIIRSELSALWQKSINDYKNSLAANNNVLKL